MPKETYIGLCGECRHFDQNHQIGGKNISGICLTPRTGLRKTLGVLLADEALEATGGFRDIDVCFSIHCRDPLLWAMRDNLIKNNELAPMIDDCLNELPKTSPVPLIPISS